MKRPQKWKAVMLWSALGLLIVVGVGQRIKGTPAPVVERYERKVPMAQGLAAQSYAEQVVFAYLTWQPDDSSLREARLKRLGASDVFAPSEAQTVIYAQADRVREAGPKRAFIYVDTLLGRKRGEQNVTVAVPVTAQGAKLGLFAQPTLLPGTKYPTRERIGVEDNADQQTHDQVFAAVSAFFKLAATTNDPSRLSYFAAKGAEVHPIAALPGSSFTGFDETQFELRGGKVFAYVAARLKDPNGDELVGSYYLTLAQQGERWLIEEQTP